VFLGSRSLEQVWCVASTTNQDGLVIDEIKAMAVAINDGGGLTDTKLCNDVVTNFSCIRWFD